MPTSQFTIDLSQDSSVVPEHASQAFGGEFTILDSLYVPKAGYQPESIINSISSVSATITNQIGASNSIQTAVQ